MQTLQFQLDNDWNVVLDNDPRGFTYNSNCNNLRTVNAIDFLFSTLHSTPFHYVKIDFGALHKHSASVTKSDTPITF